MSNLSYPDLTPTFARSFTPPDFGLKVEQFNTVEFRTAFNPLVASGSSLKFEYTQRTAVELQTIQSFYNDCLGSFRRFSIPLSIWRHSELYSESIANLLKNISWRFAEPIKTNTVKQDAYDFEVSFITLVDSTYIPDVEDFPCGLVIN